MKNYPWQEYLDFLNFKLLKLILVYIYRVGLLELKPEVYEKINHSHDLRDSFICLFVLYKVFKNVYIYRLQAHNTQNNAFFKIRFRITVSIT